jgi:hypothetical protein
MALGPMHPVWSKLYVALAKLAAACGAPFAFVLDEGNGLWCVGLTGSEPTTATTEQDRAADRFYRKEVVPREALLRRGNRVQVVCAEGQDRYVALSFAGIYVVVVWFDAPFEPFLVLARIRRALPEIEALTLALPPSGGPGTDAAAARIRA